MARPKPKVCAGCSTLLRPKVKGVWCPECRPTVKPVVVEMSAAQRKRLEALAVVRNVSSEEAMRQCIDLQFASVRGRRATKAG